MVEIIEKREDVEIEYATAILLFLSNSTHTALIILISSSYPTYTLLKPLNKHIILTPSLYPLVTITPYCLYYAPVLVFLD